MPLQRKREPAARETVTRTRSGEEVEKIENKTPMGEVVETHPLCNVGLSISHTCSSHSHPGVLADYEAVKFDVSLHVPCEQEDVDEAFEAVKAWVLERQTQLTKEILGV